jgi:predicted RNA-binding Zn-ribbon protein involved in translation (DUF1610 family)
MAIMDKAVVNGSTVFFPQDIKRIFTLEPGQEIKVPNGWGHTALVYQGSDIIGYCCKEDILPIITENKQIEFILVGQPGIYRADSTMKYYCINCGWNANVECFTTTLGNKRWLCKTCGISGHPGDKDEPKLLNESCQGDSETDYHFTKRIFNL